MASTWATRLLQDAGHDLRLYFTIQGIANVFQEDSTDVPSTIEASARARTKLVVSIEQSETRLNLATRRIEGGSLTIRLQDDDDGTLSALFAPRSYRKSYCAADHTTASTTITVKSAGFASSSGGTVYIGGETITYTGKTSTTLTGCTRGAYSSEAQTHYGETSDGEDVFTVPPSWEGRRVYLTGYFLDDDGTTTSDLSSSLGVYRMSEAPRYIGDDVWEIACTDLVEEFGNKKIGGGLRTVQIKEANSHPAIDPSTMQMDVTLDSAADWGQFVVGGSSIATHALVSYKDINTPLIFAVVAQGASPVVTLDFSQQLVTIPEGSTDLGLAAFGHETITSMKHIAVLSTDPATTALAILTSRLGDGTNGTYDLLPGLDQSSFGDPSWRMGAGISSSEVNTSAFTSAATLGIPWSYVIDEEMSLSDFMFEFCLVTGTAWFVNRSGQIDLATLAEDGTASVLTVGSSIIADDPAPTVAYDESAVYPRLHLECNYNVLTNQYDVTYNAEDIYIQKRYPGREDSLDLRSKSIVLDVAPSSVARPSQREAFFEPIMRRIQASEGRGRAYVQCACHLPILQTQIADVVTLTVAVPDLEGAASIAGRVARVTAMRPRWSDGEVDCTFEILDDIYRIAPAVIIASASSATLTLQTTGPETASSSPANMFQDGWTVEVWDVSGATKESIAIVAHTATTLTLGSAPSFAIEPGVDFVRVSVLADNAGQSSNDDNNLLPDAFLYQMPDDENDGTADPITRWR